MHLGFAVEACRAVSTASGGGKGENGGREDGQGDGGGGGGGGIEGRARNVDGGPWGVGKRQSWVVR